ncbi:MAG TPA: YdcF family protein [archaeon]|nr:YdcF family protein [archaeon]
MTRRFCAGCLVCLAIPLVIILFAGLTHRWWLSQIGTYLVLDEPPIHSDAIVAVSGEESRRIWALNLYKQGVSSLLIFNLSDTTFVFGRAIDSRSSVLEMAAEYGVPADSIILNSDILSTWDDALATRATVERLGLSSLLVVSSPFNMRRVALTYRHLLKDLPVRMRFCSVPLEKEKLSLDAWWTRERELQLVNNEYIKIVFYYFKYFL